MRRAVWQTHSILVVPVKFNERVLGVFEALNKEGPYTGEDILLHGYAGSAGGQRTEQRHA